MKVPVLFVVVLTVAAATIAAAGRTAAAAAASAEVVGRIPTNTTDTPIVPFAFPLFKQCDPKWGNDIINTKTVCEVGCLMSSTSMGLAGTGILIDRIDPANPGSLNTWLKANGGYDGQDDLEESVVSQIDPSRVAWPADGKHETNDLAYGKVAEYVELGRIVIANVMKGRHFVLVIGYSEDKDTLYVNDPGFDTLSYSYSKDVVGYRIFDMKRVNSTQIVQ